jgi:single-strand DNA-binding protein
VAALRVTDCLQAQVHGLSNQAHKRHKTKGDLHMSYQNTIIIGNVGGEVTLRTTKTGKHVANFSIAVNERFGDQEQTSWFQVVAWEQLAQISAEHSDKGQLLLVEGRVSASTWTDQNGGVQVALKLTARKIRFLGGKPGEQD